jgi:hypothetical protein
LGDYCLPPDKKEETLGGIKSCKTSEYADPYETKQIVEGIVQFYLVKHLYRKSNEHIL